MDIAGTQYLLGIRPELDGLRLDPRLPVDWPGFTATRRYRGCRVELTVTNGPGRPRLWLDGAEMPDNLIPASALAGRGSIHAHLEFSP
jgi:cellobiose phosphorylase